MKTRLSVLGKAFGENERESCRVDPRPAVVMCLVNIFGASVGVRLRGPIAVARVVSS